MIHSSPFKLLVVPRKGLDGLNVIPLQGMRNLGTNDIAFGRYVLTLTKMSREDSCLSPPK
jgi:hypothetical protein